MPKFPRPPNITDEMHANLEADDVCPLNLIEELIDALANCDTVEAAAAAHARWKGQADRSLLPKLPSLPVEECGRLAFWRALNNHITLAIEAAHGPGLLTDTDVAQIISQITGDPSSFSKEEAEILFETYISDLPISNAMVWFFLVDDRIDVDAELGPNSCLPWRLGLDRVASGSRYIAMLVEASAVSEARQPCNVDVDFHYHRLWRAGGETLKLPDTPDRCDPRGCHEIVAPPPTFSNLTAPLRAAIAL